MSSPEKFSLPLLLSFTPLSLCGATLSVADSVQVARQDTVSGAEVRLKSALVVGARQNRVENTAMGLSFLRPEQIRGIPTLMGEADLIKALQMQPGVSSGVEGFAGMMVRGGNDDQNLFLIDGNPIYQMNHLGGLFSAYNIGAVRDVAFYKGAFPARYGGRLSSVVDIATLSGDVERYRGNVTLGLTSANVAIGGPIVKRRTSFNIALRRTWLELLTIPAFALANQSSKEDGEENTARYAFTDLNVHVNHRASLWGTFSLIGYWGQDNLSSKSKSWNVRARSPAERYDDLFSTGLCWGNRLVAGRWQLPVGEHWLHSLTVAYTGYGSKSRLRSEGTMGAKESDNYEYYNYEKTVRNGIDDMGLHSQWIWSPSVKSTLRTGLDYMHHHFTPERQTQQTNHVGAVPPATEGSIDAHEAAAYADAEQQVSKLLRVNAGLRISDFRVKDKNYWEVEPRLSINCVLSPSWSVKAGYARMGQYVQQVSTSYISLPTDYWMPVTDRHPPLVSDLCSLGGYYTFHNRWNISVETWYKHMNHLLDYRDGAGLMTSATSWSDKLTEGEGVAYGVDVLVEKNFGGWAGFLGYGWLWTDRHFPELNRGRHFPSKYDHRHKLNVALSYRPSKRWELNAAWTYTSGSWVTLALESYDYDEKTNPLTPLYPSERKENVLPYVSRRNNYRLPAYHRMDIGINHYTFHKSGRVSIWTLSVYNAYCRMNPIMVRRTTSQVVDDQNILRDRDRFKLLSIFPILPSVSYTLRF